MYWAVVRLYFFLSVFCVLKSRQPFDFWSLSMSGWENRMTTLFLVHVCCRMQRLNGHPIPSPCLCWDKKVKWLPDFWSLSMPRQENLAAAQFLVPIYPYLFQDRKIGDRSILDSSLCQDRKINWSTNFHSLLGVGGKIGWSPSSTSIVVIGGENQMAIRLSILFKNYILERIFEKLWFF